MTPCESARVCTPPIHEPVATLPLTLATCRPLAAPHKRRRGFVPVTGHRLEPGDDLAGVARVLSVQCPTLQDPLDTLGHVQPRAPHRCVQRHDAMFKQPADKGGGSCARPGCPIPVTSAAAEVPPATS